MKKLRFLLVAIVMVFGFAAQSHADLTVVGTGTITSSGAGNGGTYQLIYDSGQNITWLDYSAPKNTWQNQAIWAQTLTVNFNGQNLTGWSLPTTVDGPYVFGTNGSTMAGYNITSSQMGYLYYVDLRNNGYYDTNGNYPQSDWGLTNVGPFRNLLGDIYWSGTEYSAVPSNAWNFYTFAGSQALLNKSSYVYALAVRPGDVAVTPTPIPAAAYLFGSGLLGLVGLRKKLMS